MKTFGPVGKVRVSFGKEGFIAQPRDHLYAAQSMDQEFVKPKPLRWCFYLNATEDKAPEEPIHFALASLVAL